MYSRPVVPLLLSLMSGIVCGARWPGLAPVSLAVALVFFAFLISAARRNRASRFYPLILFFSLGFLSIHPWVAPRHPPHHILNHAGKGPLHLTGTIAAAPARRESGSVFPLRVEGLLHEGESLPACGKLRVTVAGPPPPAGLFPGDKVSFTTRIREPRNFDNPGGFDYRRYLLLQGISATVFFASPEKLVLEKRSESGLRTIVASARARISALIEGSAPANAAPVLQALLLGETGAVPAPLREAFNRSGISHILAISGLHIGIVAVAAFLFFRWCLSFFRPLLWRAWTRKGAAVLTFIPVIAYGLLAGMSPSTQRAVLMTAVFLAAILSGREYDPLNTLASAAILILMLFPPSLFSISFQLSFAAVLAIFSFLPKTGPAHDDSRFLRFRKWAVSLFAVSIAAMIGTLPLVMGYFNRISLIGIFANFILVPLIGFLVVPLGLASAFVSLFSETAASLGFRASGAILDPSIRLVTFFSGLPFSSIRTFTPTGLETVCYYALAWGILHLKGEWRKAGRIAAAAAFLLLAADGVYWFDARFRLRELRVTMLDVGHGNASLLELPGGSTLLVDGGGFSDNAVFDIGEKVIAPFLWRKKIMTVDRLVLTHPNSDHLNGLVFIAENFNVKSLWTNGEPCGARGYSDLFETVRRRNIAAPPLPEIPRSIRIGEVEVSRLYPPEDFMERRIKEKWRDFNNNSLVTRVAFGSFSFLFPGDIMAEAEEELARSNPEALRSTILLSPHHGSATSSTEAFLSRVSPEIVIVSNGPESRFRLPHPAVLARYRDRGLTVYRTSENGAVTLTTDGRTLRVETRRE